MKNRYVYTLLVVLACAYALTGCTGEDAQHPDPTAPPQATTATPYTPAYTGELIEDHGSVPHVEEPANLFYFTVRGNTILLDEDINDVLARLGEPLSTFDVPSCAFDGMDRFFLFPGVQIQTYPVGGMDRVHTILLTDDSLTTVGGIFIGSPLSAVLDVYGHDYNYSYGLYIFTRGNTTLRFLVQNLTVQTISYELIGV